METGEVKGIPCEQVKRDLEEKFGPFDDEGYENQIEVERVRKEKIHVDAFVGITPLEEPIKKIYSDYWENVGHDRTKNPWKYKTENTEPVTATDQ
jgi:hypothetical protein